MWPYARPGSSSNSENWRERAKFWPGKFWRRVAPARVKSKSPLLCFLSARVSPPSPLIFLLSPAPVSLACARRIWWRWRAGEPAQGTSGGGGDEAVQGASYGINSEPAWAASGGSRSSLSGSCFSSGRRQTSSSKQAGILLRHGAPVLGAAWLSLQLGCRSHRGKKPVGATGLLLLHRRLPLLQHRRPLQALALAAKGPSTTPTTCSTKCRKGG